MRSSIPHSPRPALELTTGDAHAAFTDDLAPRRLDLAGLSMILYPASPFDGGLAGLFLRPTDGTPPVPLIGPRSRGTTAATPDAVARHGEAGGLTWLCTFSLAEDGHGWRWVVTLRNDTDAPVSCDLVATQDFALAPYGAVRTNEYYVSQYLDLSPLSDPDFGTAIAVRQNMPGPRQPWAALACLGRGTSWATDALQLRGTRDGRRLLDVSRLPSARLQHEHTLAALASEPITISPGQEAVTGFVGVLVEDHPEATNNADAAVVREARAAASARQTAAAPTPDAQATGCAHLFESPAAPAAGLTDITAERWFPGRRDLVEIAPDGSVWAFRTESGEHVTARDKEMSILRPHGQLLRTGDALTPDTGLLTSTIWMRGVFASQVTVGHVSRGAVLSGDRTYLGLQDAHGLRMFVRREGAWELLGVPTAWALRLDGARWLYDLDGSQVEVATTAATETHRLDFTVTTSGSIDRVLVAAQLALGGDDGHAPASVPIQRDGDVLTAQAQGRVLRINFGGQPFEHGGAELLFADGADHDQAWLCCLLDAPGEVAFTLTAQTDAPRLAEPLRQPGLWGVLRSDLRLTAPGLQDEVPALDATLPWFAHDALVHYLSPRGLEQYTGGGWGTRDVCQGPVGLLTALGRDDALRDVLLRVFRDQNERGDWPQAFDFLPPDGDIGQWDSHGDVVYWPLLATGDYLLATGDAGLLAEPVPSRGDGVRAPAVPVATHVRRAVAYIESTLVDGTPLPAYGHGDWNDSLQPADPRLASHMASTWTATLQSNALGQLAEGLRAASAEPELADRCAALAASTKEALTTTLLADGVLSGYAVFDGDPANPELLVHPRDRRTGLTYGVLPWIHAIAGDQLSPADARRHLDLLDAHLRGPDGARLFDKPPAYRGGPMEIFQRAEAATFWGREIGLMYTHAHLRYCEALARVGDAARLWEGLLLAVPIGLTERVPVARPRQTTCYYSSSDGDFADRYAAAAHYPELLRGLVHLEGGWRVYSSGPGLFLRLVVENLLGVRRRARTLELDPVLPPGLDGLQARVPYEGGVLNLRYAVGAHGSGVTGVRVDGRPVATTPLVNPYRTPGAAIDRAGVRPGATLDVEVGR
ncbi:MAG: hypothetical protein ACYC1E_02715 [Propionibacteriaceae bacterium]